MTTATLTATLGAMTRAQIAQWAAQHGFSLGHCTHYKRAYLIGWVTELWQYQQQQKGA